MEASQLSFRRIFIDKIPIALAIVLYLLIYLLRLQQVSNLPSRDLNLDLFKTQRQVLDKKVSEYLPSPQAELLSGILLGQSKNLPAKLKLALRDTSTLHIAVASGQNLTIVAGFFLSLSGLIKRKNALILGLCVAIGYTLLSGAQIPILRAAIMFSLASIAQFTGRQRSGFWMLLVTAGLMLWVNPSWISSLSFQLSFLATLGVVVVAPIFLKYFNKLPIIGSDLAVSLGAQIMVTPVIIQNFHQFSLVSLFANILILWTIPFIMIGGIFMLVAGLILPILGSGIGIIVNVLIAYLIYIIEFFSSLSYAWMFIGEQSWILWLGYYILIGGIMLLLNNAKDENSRRSE